MNNGLETRYFLSALTGAGYYALHRQFLRPPERYFCILKGGPGCGKSTFLKRVGDAGQAAGLAVVRLHCAGDPASLDGVYFPEKRSGFFDGTAPHTVEPALFGGCRRARCARHAGAGLSRGPRGCAPPGKERLRAGIRHAGQGHGTRPVRAAVFERHHV